jgi:hypothetical protein
VPHSHSAYEVFKFQFCAQLVSSGMSSVDQAVEMAGMQPATCEELLEEVGPQLDELCWSCLDWHLVRELNKVYGHEHHGDDL